jgi:hypothetical protein
MNKIRVVILYIIIGLFLFIFQNKEINPVPAANAQTCPIPAQVTNVAVIFPSCVGTVCNFTQGSCTWATVSGAINYKVMITDVETSAVVPNQQVDPANNSVIFSVAESNTYKCDVSAINSCGATGAIGTASLFCKVDAAVTTPTPTPTPTVAPTVVPTSMPTVAPTVVPTPIPVMPVTGDNVPLMLFGFLSIVLIISGITLFRF